MMLRINNRCCFLRQRDPGTRYRIEQRGEYASTLIPDDRLINTGLQMSKCLGYGTLRDGSDDQNRVGIYTWGYNTAPRPVQSARHR